MTDEEMFHDVVSGSYHLARAARVAGIRNAGMPRIRVFRPVAARAEPGLPPLPRATPASPSDRFRVACDYAGASCLRSVRLMMTKVRWISSPGPRQLSQIRQSPAARRQPERWRRVAFSRRLPSIQKTLGRAAAALRRWGGRAMTMSRSSISISLSNEAMQGRVCWHSEQTQCIQTCSGRKGWDRTKRIVIGLVQR